MITSFQRKRVNAIFVWFGGAMPAMQKEKIIQPQMKVEPITVAAGNGSGPERLTAGAEVIEELTA